MHEHHNKHKHGWRVGGFLWLIVVGCDVRPLQPWSGTAPSATSRRRSRRCRRSSAPCRPCRPCPCGASCLTRPCAGRSSRWSSSTSACSCLASTQWVAPSYTHNIAMVTHARLYTQHRHGDSRQAIRTTSPWWLTPGYTHNIAMVTHIRLYTEHRNAEVHHRRRPSCQGMHRARCRASCLEGHKQSI